MALGEKLKYARLKSNFSQDYLAEMLNISQKTYSNFENNKTIPDFGQIEKISEILGVSILDFLTDDKLAFYQTNSTGANNGLVINQLSEKIIEQYELRIKKLDEENQYLKLLLDKFVN
ncbi:helix-turn-helix transcriptional regulator [Weeksellaceae bacterium A-14]|uniref:helix-turn-helix domain-containing protein n=1 Tax=Daejeonia sp. YH14 TaxID=3439042 RepID=UPI0031E4A4CC